MNSQRIFCRWFENQWLHSEEGKAVGSRENVAVVEGMEKD